MKNDNLKFKIVFIAIMLSLFGLAGKSYAAPSVSGLVGTANQGNSITISGTGFGTHEDESPNDANTIARLWDDFETGICSTAAGKWDWGNSHAGVVMNTSNNRAGSAYCAEQIRGTGMNASLNHQGDSSKDSLYMASWRYFEPFEPEEGTNFKIFRVYSTGTATFNQSIDSGLRSSLGLLSTIEQSDPVKVYYAGDHGWGADKISGWHFYELWMDVSGNSFAGRVDGREMWSFNDLEWSNSAGTWNPYRIVYDQFVSQAGRTDKTYTDDAYLSFTQARVMISDHSTWDDAHADQHQEIQIPTAWADGSITTTINQGSFSSGETAYLYVFDETGTPNATGYLITFGQEYAETPIISGVDGTYANGQTIAINGNGFGTKSPVSPILWDTFDDGIDEGALSDKTGWHDHRDNGAKYTITSPYGGNGFCVYNYITYDHQSIGFDTSYYLLSSYYDELYVSYMFRHVGTDYASGGVEKNWRISTWSGESADEYSSDGMLAMSDGYVFFREGSTSIYPTTTMETNGYSRYFVDYGEYGSSTWMRYQGYVKYSSPAGTSNGVEWVAVGPHKREYLNRTNRPAGETYGAHSFLLGLMHDADVNEGEYHYMYADDVYIDNTLARVEVCNADTKSESDHCEIQIPENVWNDEQLQIKINQGSFANGSAAYLYVVDSNGEVNENGYQITFSSSGGDVTSPATPSGLSVS